MSDVALWVLGFAAGGFTSAWVLSLAQLVNRVRRG